MDSVRSQLLDSLRRELTGPDPVPGFERNGEEILFNEPPRLRYLAGILFPQKVEVTEIERADKLEQRELDFPGFSAEEAGAVNAGGEPERGTDLPDDSSAATDDVVNMANSYLPSAMGLSCYVKPPEEGFQITVRAGVYEPGEHTFTKGDGNSITGPAHIRHTAVASLMVSQGQLPKVGKPPLVMEVCRTDGGGVLNLHIANRTRALIDGLSPVLYTFSLVNASEVSGARLPNELCFFQVELVLRAADKSPCFAPFPRRAGTAADEDTMSNELLYRNIRTYAIGHGCAAAWDEPAENGMPTSVRTEVMPVREVKPVKPRELPDLPLSMLQLSDAGNRTEAINLLSGLCDRYAAWIGGVAADSVGLELDLRETAQRHVEQCRICCVRMRNGVEVLREDDLAWRAFALMNRAMLMQQLRYKLRLRRWQMVDGRMALETGVEPDIADSTTWPDRELGRWYPFQIAFILLNLPALADPSGEARGMVDLLWFPTGGGKTEAYLGLTAFVVFLRRLRDPEDAGTSVIMRYTLRLLTAQQFQRAASLVTACEAIRLNSPEELGTERITLGLWVGNELTPNKRVVALQKHRDMTTRRTDDNPFVLTRCPWCGAEFGQVYAGHGVRLKGYHKRTQPPPTTVVFKCDNPDCTFCDPQTPLPLLVIDEDIYDKPPSVLIGTVDKFAMLPWRPESRTLFGFRDDGVRASPPDLVIQDELHLISGPLGSLAGLYETAVAKLCEHADSGTGPKVVASTATISRARTQCQALYACPETSVRIFPPPGLDYCDSFFAVEDGDAPGRLYVGVFPTAGMSGVATHARIMAALLQGVPLAEVGSEHERDPYWTVVDYFNSLRELGHAATLVRAEITERIKTLCLRKGLYRLGLDRQRRSIRKQIELTSRVPSGWIAASLADLETAYPATGAQLPVDICLATSMLSVGVDVQRLGLMVVTGQPKLTSEYIQVTSRVGRSDVGPGLVVVQYNPARPRDRSHYEHFQSYHARLYAQVEPTSVTPFSVPARERALHAVLVALLRLMCERLRQHPSPPPSDEELELVHGVLRDRVAVADPEEASATMALLAVLEQEWRRFNPTKYGGFEPPTDVVPLMYPASDVPRPAWGKRPWPTQTSMRGVEPSCEGHDIREYPNANDGETR